MLLRTLLRSAAPHFVASPRRAAGVERALSSTRSRVTRARGDELRARLATLAERARGAERHPCDMADGNDARGICGPVHGHRAMKRMKPITTLARPIARGAMVGPPAGEVAGTSFSVDNGGTKWAKQGRQVAGRGARGVERMWSFGGQDRAKIEDNKVARSAGGRRGEAVASWGIARVAMSIGHSYEGAAEAGFSTRNSRRWGSVPRGGARRWRGPSGKNGAPGGSTTADNSLALSVNGKCCGECQCVTMNHGSKNQTVARSGGGL